MRGGALPPQDGWDGPTCEDPHEAFCINQCSGHGECQHGFCKCHAGWFGHDCAYRTADTPWTPGKHRATCYMSEAGPSGPPACLQRLHGVGAWAAVGWNALPRGLRPLCARDAAGMEDKERPWLKLHVNTPAARDPEPDATRRRPLIYIYELPAVYNTNLLQVGCRSGANNRVPGGCLTAALCCRQPCLAVPDQPRNAVSN